MKTFLILLILTGSLYAEDTIATITYTDGIDETTNTLLPTSDWTLEIAPTYTTECTDISPELKLHKSVLVPVTSYINRDFQCDNTTHAGYEAETYISWVDFGYSQKPEFGNETLNCPVYGQCEMDRVVNTSDKSFADIPLENGEHGTQNGTAKVFVMKLNSLNVQSVPGTGGLGGRNDLPVINPVVRYCVKVQDAVTPDATIASSKIPYATVQAYSWTPVSFGAGGANGSDAPTNKKVEVYEGLSETALKRLKGEYFQ
jgi:hypothetical protein